MNAGLLYSAVDKTNIALVEERLTAKLQRVQTVTIFAGLLFSNAGIQTIIVILRYSIAIVSVVLGLNFLVTSLVRVAAQELFLR